MRADAAFATDACYRMRTPANVDGIARESAKRLLLPTQHRPFNAIACTAFMKRLLAGIYALLLIAPRATHAQDSSHAISLPESQELTKFDTLWLNFLRRRNARDFAITTPNGVQQDRYIELGGIEQWVSVRGEDRNNPVLLLVHGGPGDATSGYGYALLRSWFKRFTVVQWDQRGAGETYARNGASTPDVTIDRIVQDGIELADSLRNTFRKTKIILVGHSFGSTLGLRMIRARPDLFYAFVGSGQIGASASTTLAVGYRELMAAAKGRGEKVAVEELTAIGPPPWKNGSAYAVQHKWANLLGHEDFFLDASLAAKMTAPGATFRSLNADFDGELFSGDQLVPQINALDSSLYAGTFAVPVFVFQGANDFTAPISLARAFVRSIRAPRKDFVVIPQAGHFALFSQPDAFLNALSAHLTFAK